MLSVHWYHRKCHHHDVWKNPNKWLTTGCMEAILVRCEDQMIYPQLDKDSDNQPAAVLLMSNMMRSSHLFMSADPNHHYSTSNKHPIKQEVQLWPTVRTSVSHSVDWRCKSGPDQRRSSQNSYCSGFSWRWNWDLIKTQAASKHG